MLVGHLNLVLIEKAKRPRFYMINNQDPSNLIKEADETIFDLPLIEKTWQLHQAGRKDNSSQLWALLIFLDWFRGRSVSF